MIYSLVAIGSMFGMLKKIGDALAEGLLYFYSRFILHTYCWKTMNHNHGCQMAIARFIESYVFGPSGFWTMAPLRYAAKFDPFLSLD